MTDDGMRVERDAGALGDVPFERQQVEAVAGGEQTEELVFGHDLAVGAEALRALDGMPVPRRRPRGEVVHTHVADEHLIGGVGARGGQSRRYGRRYSVG